MKGIDTGTEFMFGGDGKYLRPETLDMELFRRIGEKERQSVCLDW